MADVKNVITGGIGAAPGGLVWFFTGGLESATVELSASHIIRVLVRDRAIEAPKRARTVGARRRLRVITASNEN
jgi:hypothetical protein